MYALFPPRTLRTRVEDPEDEESAGREGAGDNDGGSGTAVERAAGGVRHQRRRARGGEQKRRTKSAEWRER